MRCSNSEYSFLLIRKSPDLPYTIRDVADGTERVREFGHFFEGFLSAPYAAFGRPVREIMERPDLQFKLGDISEVTYEVRPLFRISFGFKPSPKIPTASAWIEVDPTLGWAVRRFQGLYGTKLDHSRTGSVEYSGMESGRPIVRRVVNSDWTEDETLDITEIGFDRHPNPRDFTLSAFGLPELNQKPGQPDAIPLNYWLFGFGALALVLAILVRRANRPGRPDSALGQSS